MSEIVHPMSSSARQMSAIVEVGRNSLAFAKFTAFIKTAKEYSIHSRRLGWR
jgi:hypothetical protein